MYKSITLSSPSIAQQATFAFVRRVRCRKKFAILCNSAQQTKSLTPSATALAVGTVASRSVHCGDQSRSESETVANVAADTPSLPDGQTTCIVRRSQGREGERLLRSYHHEGRTKAFLTLNVKWVIKESSQGRGRGSQCRAQSGEEESDQ